MASSEAERPIDNVTLTRHASYLIAQNVSPRKLIIAFAQTYETLFTIHWSPE